jgi:DNA-binding SARP family transcriptional activator
VKPEGAVRFHFLGTVQIERDGEPVRGFHSRKALALLAYLVMQGRPVPRERLADLFWGDKTESQGRTNLSWTLNRITSQLPDCLRADRHTVAFVPAAAQWLDVAAFEELVEEEGIEALAEAVGLYRGEFLEGLTLEGCVEFELWVVGERERWRQRVTRVLRELVAHYSQCGEYEEGLRFGRRLLALEPWREEAHREMMRLLAWSGQRGAALAQYERCCQALEDELGVEPAAETVQLYEWIKTGELSSLSPRSPSTRRAGLSPFVVGPPITAPRQFFGRERELQRVFGLWRRFPLQHVAVIGLRRSGKTSLLHYLKDITRTASEELRPGQRTDWLSQPERYRWILVDFQDARMGNRARLLSHLLTSLDLPVPEPCNLETFMDVVSRLLHAPAVILMDEIGAGLASPELDQSFWWSLRSLVSHQTDGNLAFVLTAHASPVQLAQDHGKPSPFFNIFHTLELGPFSDAEARELIGSSPRPFAAADVAWILDQSGRWPCLLQILCHVRLAALEAGETGDTWQEDGLRQMAPFRYLLEK